MNGHIPPHKLKPLIRAPLFCALACMAAPAQSVDFQWIGSDGGDFLVGSNWNQSGAVPGPSDNFFLTTFNDVQTINLNGDASVLGGLIEDTGGGLMTLSFSGGTFNVGNTPDGSLIVGNTGQGAFAMTGGTLNILNSDVNTAAFVIGNQFGSVGTFTQSGGDVQGGRSLTIAANGGTGTYSLGNADPGNAPTTTLTTGYISLGYAGTGTFNQSAGTLNTTGDIYLGGDQGFYTLSGGDLVVTDSGDGSGTIVGTFGTGEFDQSGGTHTANELNLGQNGATGTYNQTGGLVTLGVWYSGQILANGQTAPSATAAMLTVGAAGTGYYNLGLSGQANDQQWTGYPGQPDPLTFPSPPTFDDLSNAPYLQLYGNAIIGRDTGSNGTFAIAGDGSVLNINYVAEAGSGGTMVVGSSGMGTFTQTDQTTVYIDGGLAIGLNEGSVGSYTIGAGANGAGSLSVGGDLNIGGSDNVGGPTAQTTAIAGNGTFTQDDGNVQVYGNLNIATNQDAVGNYYLNGGSLNVGNDGSFGNNGGTGTFTQTGGTATFANLVLGTTPGGGPASTGTYLLGQDGQLQPPILNVTGNMILGDAVGTFGNLTIAGTGTQLKVGGDLFVGGDGSGAVSQTDGDVSVLGTLHVGGYFDSNNVTDHFGPGFYEISGGSVTAGDTTVGDNSQGRVLQTGGTFNAGSLTLGSSGLFSAPDGNGGYLFYSSGIYDLQGGTLNTNGTTVSVFGLGMFNQSDTSGNSLHEITGDLVVGAGPAVIEANSGQVREGIYTLSGGVLTSVLTVSGNAVIGAGNGVNLDSGFAGEPGAKGSFNETGGSVEVTGNLVLGQSGNVAGGTGTYTLSAGTLHVMGDTFIGGSGLPDGLQDGIGTFTQTGGTHTTDGTMTVGLGQGTGTYNLSSTDPINNPAVLNTLITYLSADNSTFNQDGGTHNTGFLNVYGGQYNLSAGTINVAGNMGVGGPFNSATFHQTGGDVFVNDANFGLYVGGFPGSGQTGTYKLDAGTLTVVATTHVGSDAAGTFNQNGGIHTTGLLVLGENAAGNGTYNLSDGHLSATNEQVGLNGVGTFTQGGGTNTVSTTLNIAANGSSYNLQGGLLRAASIGANGANFNFTGGTLSVDTFNGNLVNNGGTLSPGNSPGTTHIVGDYTQTAAGLLSIELGGTGAGMFDVVNVDGKATLAGTLNVSFWNGFTATAGESFNILSATDLTGTFDVTHLAALNPGLQWQVAYLYNQDAFGTDYVNLSVAAVPEPETWAMMMAGLALVGFAARRQRA